MTDRSRQKSKERSEAFQAMLKLGQEWQFENRESPDFLITSDTGEVFGLEVTDVYVGSTNRNGSRLRALEDANHAWLTAIRQDYESRGGPDLHVRYTGSTSLAARDQLFAALRDERLEEKSPLSGSATLKLEHGTAYVHRTPHPYWMMLDDRSGTLSNDGARLQDAIDRKAAKLAGYRAVCTDVRLLVVAMKVYNSGKLELQDHFRPDLRGFDAVYFFSYPSQVIAFTAAHGETPVAVVRTRTSDHAE